MVYNKFRLETTEWAIKKDKPEKLKILYIIQKINYISCGHSMIPNVINQTLILNCTVQRPKRAIYLLESTIYCSYIKIFTDLHETLSNCNQYRFSSICSICIQKKNTCSWHLQVSQNQSQINNSDLYAHLVSVAQYKCKINKHYYFKSRSVRFFIVIGL